MSSLYGQSCHVLTGSPINCCPLAQAAAAQQGMNWDEIVRAAQASQHAQIQAAKPGMYMLLGARQPAKGRQQLTLTATVHPRSGMPHACCGCLWRCGECGDAALLVAQSCRRARTHACTSVLHDTTQLLPECKEALSGCRQPASKAVAPHDQGPALAVSRLPSYNTSSTECPPPLTEAYARTVFALV